MKTFFFFLVFNENSGKIPLNLVFNRFGIATTNFLAAQGATGVERL